MRLAVVVVNWNSRSDLASCLASLRLQTHRDLEVVVIDNGSTDGSAAMVERDFPEVQLLPQDSNLGFAEACNLGIEASTAPWVAMLNNDATAEPRWAEALVTAAEGAPAACGMLQSLMLFQQRPGIVNSSGIELVDSGGGRDRWEGRKRPEEGGPIEEIFCPTAGAAAYRREMLEATRVEGMYFDADHFCYYEDLDLGWRARLAGWTAMFVPDSVVLHRYHGSTSRRGKEWLVVTSGVNRIRTLLKNASWEFLLQTRSMSYEEARRVVRFGGLSGGLKLVRAVRSSLRRRARVGDLAARGREDVEREWVIPEASPR